LILKFTENFKTGRSFPLLKGARGMILILNSKNSVFSTIKSSPCPPSKGGKHRAYLKFSIKNYQNIIGAFVYIG
jgi:hypothetical protein